MKIWFLVCLNLTSLFKEINIIKTKNTLEQYIIITKNDCECFNIWNQIYSPNTFTEELKLSWI